MTLLFYDRISGKSSSSAPKEPVLGRWLVETRPPVTLNTNPVRGTVFLVPNAQGQWQLKDMEHATEFSGLLPLRQIPDIREQNSLRAIGKELRLLPTDHSNWEGMATVSPVDTKILEQIQLTSLDEEIQRYLPHVQEVCQHPRMHLHTEVDRQLVSRVRRTPPQAVNYLLSHTEDWEGRQVRSVVPKRVLSTETIDLIDIYENRVTAHLVDELSAHLKRRLAALDKIESELNSLKDEGNKNPWRNKRRYTLWGQAADINEHLHELNRNRNILDTQIRRMLSLKDSVLYRGIASGTHIPSELRPTNIFVNDARYRYVATLWRKWRQTYQIVSSDVFHSNMQELCRSFDWFCMLLICRALKTLGFSCSAKGRFQPGTRIEASDSISNLIIDWENRGSISLQCEKPKFELTFVPVFSSLEQESAEELGKILSDLESNAAESLSIQDGTASSYMQLKIILYPGLTEARRRLSFEIQQQLHTLGTDLSKPKRTGFIPVSSWELDSVERIGRALRWVLLGQRLSAYPAEILVPPAFREELIRVSENCLMPATNPKQVYVKPVGNNRPFGKIEEWLSDRKREVRSRGRLTRQEIHHLEEFRVEFKRTQENYLQLGACPVCRTPNKIKHFDARHIEYECLSCNSAWGTQICGQCAKIYPFLLLGQFLRLDAKRSPGWVDEFLGQDVLATPCWLEETQVRFICPHCGHCANSQSAMRERCLRCNPHLHKDTI